MQGACMRAAPARVASDLVPLCGVIVRSGAVNLCGVFSQRQITVSTYIKSFWDIF
jgi:hypothetical protein